MSSTPDAELFVFEGSDDVYRFSGLVERAIAALVDVVVALGLAWIPFLPLLLLLALPDDWTPAEWIGWVVLVYFVAALVASVVLSLGYFVVPEAKWGCGVGKRLMRCRVVSLDGSPIRVRQSIVRNLLKLLTYSTPILLLYTLFCIFQSPINQRLGDRWAGTVVVRQVSRVAPGS